MSSRNLCTAPPRPNPTYPVPSSSTRRRSPLTLPIPLHRLPPESHLVSDQGRMPMPELLPDTLQDEEDSTKPAARVRKPSKRYSGPEWVV
ncbi:hypothetical protein GUJ93_ZPchr0009g1443 [Zizania palustris]|uniref:Uncharacterized protein n=1 Tax=Zizania palustris TaxID=103762 RepID=A0A8J5V8P1_ZIZPA|nr:hypothetical protein GUJ93_ZPchr0009g1443 [Zizania palustris]